MTYTVYRFDNDEVPMWKSVIAWAVLLSLVVAFFHYCARAPMAKIAAALKDAQRTQGAK